MDNGTEDNGDWNVTKMKLKQHFSLLTDTDITGVKSKQELMLDKIQNKLGRTKEELCSIISEV